MAKIHGISSYQTKKGIRFVVNTRESGKAIKKTGFISQLDAKKWLKNQRDLLARRPDYITKTPKWEEFVTEYRTLHLSTLKGRTKRRYEIDIKYHLSPELEFMRIDQITPRIVETLRSVLLPKLAPKTVNNCMGTLRSMLGKAMDWSYLLENPVKVKALKVKRSSDLNWWREEEYISRFMDALELDDAWGNGTRKGFKEPYRAALIMPLEVGPRLGEVCCLLVSDIDFNDKTISISKTYNDKDHVVEPTKNYETRILKFEAGSRLHQWLVESCKGKGPDDLLFATKTGKMILPSKLANTTFRKWNDRLGLPRITYHGMRHTFATWYLKRGGDIFMLYKILGHKDINTTTRLYVHRNNEILDTMSFDKGRKRGLKLVRID